MPIPSARDSQFEARWAAWLERGAVHDRAIRRRFMIFGPVAFVAAVLLYVIFVR